jgi:sugar lactone lactonase YvrE
MDRSRQSVNDSAAGGLEAIIYAGLGANGAERYPLVGFDPYELAFDKNNALWVTEPHDSRIELMDRSGYDFAQITGSNAPIDPVSITEWSSPIQGGAPDRMALGPDGNLWYTDANHGQIVRVTPP